MQKYAFLDRDGTILIEQDDEDFLKSATFEELTDLKFVNGALEGLDLLAKKGFKLVLVTNQPYLGTPKRPKKIYDVVTSKMNEELTKRNLYFDFVMMCPHGADEDCDCRKPKIGGLRSFLDTNKGHIDFEHSLMFGDRNSDEGFANNLKVRFVRIETNEQFMLPDDI